MATKYRKLGVDVIKIYYKDANRYSKLSIEEEKDLIERAKTDDAFREKLLYHNLWVVVSAVKNFGRNNKNLTELVCEGHKGLLKAIKHLDKYNGGGKFSTFVYASVNYSILSYLRKEKVNRKLSLEEISSEEIGFENKNVIRPDKIVEEKEEYQRLERALRKLNSEHQIVLREYYFEGRTMKEIGEGTYLSRKSQGKNPTRTTFVKTTISRRLAIAIEQLKKEFFKI